MRTVYAVTRGEGDSWGVQALFTSRDAAQRHVDELDAEDGNLHDSIYSIDEMRLFDDDHPSLVEHHHHQAILRPDGTVERRWERSHTYWSYLYGGDVKTRSDRWPKGGDGWRVQVEAPSHEQAAERLDALIGDIT